MKRLLLFVLAFALVPAGLYAQGGCVLQQSTASQEISIGRFVDDADGNTQMTGLTINASDVRLKKGGADWAAKNSGGATHEEAGNYRITLDATDTATLGILEIAVHVSGALSVERTCLVVPSGTYDFLVTTGPATAAAIRSEIDSNSTQLAKLGTPANLGGGATISANLSDIEAQTDDIGAAGAGLTAADDAVLAAIATVDDFVDTEVAAIKAKTDNLPSDPADESNLQAKLGTPAGASVSADIAATLASLQSSLAVKRATQFDWIMQFKTSAGAPVTSGTPVCERARDNRTFAPVSNSEQAVDSNGLSVLTLSATDMTASHFVVLKCTLATAVDYYTTFKVQTP